MIYLDISPLQINDKKEKLTENCYKLKKDVDSICKLADELAKYTKDYDSGRQKNNPYIVKRVVAHIANGLNVSDSILLAADELGESTRRVEVLFKAQRVYMTALNLFAKKYMAEKLKKSGYTTKKTAELIGVSENHVYKLLKCTNKFWELSH